MSENDTIKCAACGYEYNEKEEGKKPENEQHGGFIVSSVEVVFVIGWGEHASYRLLACPACRTVRLE